MYTWRTGEGCGGAAGKPSKTNQEGWVRVPSLIIFIYLFYTIVCYSFSIWVILLHPVRNDFLHIFKLMKIIKASRGTVSLRESSWRCPPVIDPRFLEDPHGNTNASPFCAPAHILPFSSMKMSLFSWKVSSLQEKLF